MDSPLLPVGQSGRVGGRRAGEVHDIEGAVGDLEQVARCQVLLQGGPTGFYHIVEYYLSCLGERKEISQAE